MRSGVKNGGSTWESQNFSNSSYIAKDGGSGVIVVATLYSVSIFTLELRLRIIVAALLVIR